MRQVPSAPQKHSLGHVVEQTGVTVFFGDKLSTREDVAAAFPDYQINVLNQTHSDIVVYSTSTSNAKEADAHFTNQSKLALCIRTADCIPVMIHDPDTGFVAAIHAGWRGVENEIIRKTCLALKAKGATFASARAWIGPHIHLQSFEVGKDVASKLEARFQAVQSYSNVQSVVQPHEDSTKARVDLLAIARAQLKAHDLDDDRITVLSIDTFASSEHASFRRDRDKAGRQISFIALK